MDVSTIDVSTADFSGYATKAGLKCSDGRTIMPDAFKHQDGVEVPLVWQHDDSTPENILGKAVLIHRADGVYTHAWFNDTPRGQVAKQLVQSKNITSLSIRANQLKERGKAVMHGMIRELSLVLSGANPGALIDNVAFAHSEGVTVLEDEATIYTGLDIEIQHAEDAQEKTLQDVYETLDQDQLGLVHYMIGQALEGASAKHADTGDDITHDLSERQEVYESLDEDQRELVHYMIGEALVHAEESADADPNSDDNQSQDDQTDDQKDDQKDDQGSESTATESDDSSTDHNDEGKDLAHQEGANMNVFDQNATSDSASGSQLTHSQLVAIVDAGKKSGSFKEAVLAHAEEYGITDINLLFPDAKALTTSPEFISRRMEWVSKVLGGTKHSPFAKVKTVFADITEAQARAKGYIKGNRKKEEVFKLLRRTTGPATIYKKQKLDRDDVLDITDIDVVNWLKAEMRLMIEEELARAILVGDGRSAADEDKVKDPEGALDGSGIRSILHDDDLYAIKKTLPSNVLAKDVVKAVIRATDEYRGTGAPTMFIGRSNLTELLLDEDRFGRPLYADKRALADKMGVSDIVPVDVFNEAAYQGLYAIVVALTDYTVGSNKGGELTSFEDFDIDFNQHKYLQETRLSGGLTKPYSAIVIRRELGTEVVPTAPSFDGATDTVTIPADAGVSYYNAETDAEMTGDVVITESTEVVARADEGYYIPAGNTTSWTYTP